MAEPSAIFKLCIFGEGGVGKSTLTHRFIHKVFDTDLKMTIGADFYVKDVDIDGKIARLRIWDFGGEQNFRVLMPSFAIGANGGIFMFDLTRYVTLKKLDEWLGFFKKSPKIKQVSIPVLMVGGKFDLEEKRSVSTEDAIELAKARNLRGYFECSSKTGQNVEEIFQTITREMMKEKGML